MSEMYINILGLVLAVGIVWGIKMMSSPKTAVRGNFLGAVCMLGAIILTLVSGEAVISSGLVWIAMAVGAAIGYFLAIKVTMIQMPQMVALLNGLGGGSSAAVSILALIGAVAVAGSAGAGAAGIGMGTFEIFTAALGLAVGAVTLSGSLVAAGKLDGKINPRPVIFGGQSTINMLALAVTVAGIIGATVAPPGGLALFFVALTTIASFLYGVLFTIRVGGADMPITVSLLNSLSGVAASISGFAINHPLLIAVGAIVGASGLILTQIMCRAMNRTLGQVLSGKTTVIHQPGGPKPPASSPSSGHTAPSEPIGRPKPAPPAKADYMSIVRNAKKVIVIPGYGMALGQAQGVVKQLIDKLEAGGADVRVAIHPVAGRMPGHMNVLLAEVDVPYDKLYEMDQINDEFKQADLVIVVGANDVINPAAITAEGTPIYGMPILRAHEAKHILVFNYDTKPGYAGVDNPLYTADNVTLLLGNAAETVAELVSSLEESPTCPTPSKAPSKDAHAAETDYVSIVKDAKKVIVVPGYGMALGQAQGVVKQLIDKLEAGGADVRVAIHPVAGRMPGHMNVLLAEVDLPYDKLYEMDQINDEFKQADLVIVVGANDVINPAAITAEGTPIYGMPILRAYEAKHVIVFNYDTKPGYAGVDNPLYTADNVTLLLGNAAETVADLLRKL